MLEFFINLIWLVQAAGASPSHLALPVGDTVRLAPAAPSLVRVADGRVLKAFTSKGQLFVQGRKKGSTVVHFGNQSLRISVLTGPESQLWTSILEVLKDFEGLKVLIEDDRIIVTGELLQFKDWQTLAEKVIANGAQFFFRARLWPDLIPQAKSHFIQLAKNKNLLPPQIEWTPEIKFLLPKSQIKSYQNIYSPYGIDLIPTDDLLDHSPMARVHLTVAEILKSASHHLGFEFGGSHEFKVLPKTQGPKDVTATLNWLEGQGQAKKLATSTLTTRSGSEVEFLSGGEFPVKVGSYQKREVIWKRHGLWAKIRPQVDQIQNIRLDVSVEISSPQSDGAVDGIPAIRSTRLQNQVDVQKGATLALTGLSQNLVGLAESGLPGLSDLPLLGSLFFSQSFLKSRSELVIFLTTELLPTLHQDQPSLPKGWSDEPRLDVPKGP